MNDVGKYARTTLLAGVPRLRTHPCNTVSDGTYARSQDKSYADPWKVPESLLTCGLPRGGDEVVDGG